ncbi:MAG: type II toxin-antitoxin system mRNA interferase toxin, RelE/StbE family [Chloroflexi bacterium]|nr:type II toxin-antitoxin system mRNA interferase toxin, RelE/StbE family [Chloroflexota bacterium]
MICKPSNDGTALFGTTTRKFTRRDKKLGRRIDDALRQMEEDVFVPSLSVHKLSGALIGLWACSCGYDCRVIFSLELDLASNEEVIVLLDIGTHDEVY